MVRELREAVELEVILTHILDLVHEGRMAYDNCRDLNQEDVYNFIYQHMNTEGQQCMDHQ